jgi:hypothetical protein
MDGLEEGYVGELLTQADRIGGVENPIGAHVTFYGPHECDDCEKTICKAANEQGGVKFDYPVDEPIYPNTPWNLHNCDMSKRRELPANLPHVEG